MRKLLVFLLLLALPLVCFGGPPTRTYTYTTGDVIDATKVTTNEDNLYNYLAGGVDTYKDNSIVSADIQDGVIVNADIATAAAIDDSKLANITTAGKVNGTAITGLASIPSGAGTIPSSNLPGGGITLPTGAVFFMISGSCPTGSTDVTATYANKVMVVNATNGATVTAPIESHTHTGPSHTHDMTHAHDVYTGNPYSAGRYLSDAGPGSPSTYSGYVVNSGTTSTGSAGTGATGSTGTSTTGFTCKMCQVQ